MITKSGSTAETMATYLIFRSLLVKALGKNYVENVIITTDAEKGYLRQMVREEGIKDFVIPADVGGRFSVLTPVGLLSAAVGGINIRNLLKGAKKAKSVCLRENLLKNPAHLFALFCYLYDKLEDRKITVMLPYSNHLYSFADWFRQLWAESLGKRYNLKGKEVSVGLTPIKALGTTDQHSQLQLYLEGPQDKVIVFLTLKKYKKSVKIPSAYKSMEGVHYLCGHTLEELIQSECRATIAALTKNGRPNCRFELDKISEEEIGMLIYLFEHATLFAGLLYKIDPFNQPAVELGKQFTYGLLGRSGYEDKLKEFKKIYKSSKKVITIS